MQPYGGLYFEYVLLRLKYNIHLFMTDIAYISCRMNSFGTLFTLDLS